MTPSFKGYRILLGVTLLLAAGSFFLSAFLFTNLRDVSVQGCERQNHLRRELNATLRSFHQSARFELVNCSKAYSLHLPF